MKRITINIDQVGLIIKNGEVIKVFTKGNYWVNLWDDVLIYDMSIQFVSSIAIDILMQNEELKSFTDNCGACERIKNTPIPFSYSIFLKKFIFFYVMTLPFGYVFSLGYYTIPVVIFIFYVLASLELIAEEIEDPFGGDANDLPTAKIASNIKKHVEELL